MDRLRYRVPYNLVRGSAFRCAGIWFAAPPPDVREVYDLPIKLSRFWGYAPKRGAEPLKNTSLFGRS
jgi:hypothetical protein